RAAREDDAEMAGRAADIADGPRPSHARLAKRDQRLRGGRPHLPRNQDDPSPRGRPDRHRPKDGTAALETVRRVFRRDPLDAELEGILLARTELDQRELISRLERIS